MARIRNDTAIRLIMRGIVRCRDEQGMTQQNLAELTGIGRTNLAMMESGAAGITIANLYAIAEALGVEARDLLPSMEEVKALRSVTVAGHTMDLTKSDIEGLLQQLGSGEEGE